MSAGYGGKEFLFSKTDQFPRYIDSHVSPVRLVQQKLGLRLLSHHKVGRHSVASQAVTGGESVKAVQAQLGHRSEQSTHQYAHLGSGASAPARRGAQAGASTARSGIAEWSRQPDGNERCRRLGAAE